MGGGGGYYEKVRKVGEFLNRFILAEVRIFANTADAELLDRLVTENVGGLDLALVTMTKIFSTLALTADAVPWSGLWDVMGKGYRGDPQVRWMVLYGLMLGHGEAPVLDYLHLWDLAEVLLKRS